MRISLADRETELVSVLWDRGPSTVSEEQAHLADELTYTTLLTMLRKLEAKQYVGHKEEGRAHRYHALIEREAAQDGVLKALRISDSSLICVRHPGSSGLAEGARGMDTLNEMRGLSARTTAKLLAVKEETRI